MKRVKKILVVCMLSFILMGSLKNVVNADSYQVSVSQQKRKWVVRKLKYGEFSPPPYKYYSEGGYHGYLQYKGLANEQGFAYYAGYLYVGYPIPTPSGARLVD